MQSFVAFLGHELSTAAKRSLRVMQSFVGHVRRCLQ